MEVEDNLCSLNVYTSVHLLLLLLLLVLLLLFKTK